MNSLKRFSQFLPIHILRQFNSPQVFSYRTSLPYLGNNLDISNQNRSNKPTLKVSNWQNSFENSFAFGIIKPLVNYNVVELESAKVSAILSQNLTDLTPEESLNITEQLKSELPNCSDSELNTILGRIEKYKDTEIFTKLLGTVDSEGAKRVKNAVPSVTLAGAMKMLQVNFAFRSEWIWSCLKRFVRRLDRLSSGEMLQVMFLVNLCRKFPVQYSGFDIQFHLVPHFDNLSLDQMAVVSIAFFKSQTRLNNQVIMSKILKKMHDEAAECNSYSVAMLCKIFRYSMPLTQADELYQLQTRMIEEVSRLSFKALTHLALAGTNVLIYQKDLILTIIDKLRNSTHEIRLKDMERLLFVMSLYNIRDEDFVARLVEEVKNREEEIKHFPKAYITMVNFLVIQQYFNIPMISRCLSKQFIDDTYDRSFKKIGFELICIDKTVEIELPEYSGNRLSNQMVKSAAKVMSFSTSSTLTGTQKFSYELQDVLYKFYGEQNVKFVGILPHFHFRDFVIGFDSNLAPLAAPNDWSVHHWGEVKQLPDRTNHWLAIVVGGWNMMIRNTNEPLGTTKSKLRQLRTLGFRPVLVQYAQWRLSTDKESYLKQIMHSELKEIESKRSTSSN